MVRQIVTLAGVVGGYLISLRFYDPVSKMLPPSMESGTAKAVSFIIIFIACIIAASILGVVAGRILKITGLSWANRVGGGLAGFAKGFIIIELIVTILIAFLPAENSLLRDSITLPYAVIGIKTISGAIPDDIRVKYGTKLETLKNDWIQKGVKTWIDEKDGDGKKRTDKHSKLQMGVDNC